ncbi:MAG: acyl carrier protein [Cognaticolwellia sp.]|jgi:acyl carrier protein
MSAIVTDPQIAAKVQNAIAEALGLDDDEVEADARLMQDLGAESLDFLDIVFRLERSFDVKIPRGGIEAQATSTEDEGPYELDGVLTELGRKRLAQAMPEVPSEDFKAGLKASEIPTLFRVATFTRLVIALLEEKKKGA